MVKGRLAFAAVGVAGAGIGFVLGWLITGRYAAANVAAAGTWVGAFATITTILWAIHSFRADTEAKRRERLEAEELSAQGVRYRLLGGGGHGVDGELTMTSVTVRMTNESTEFVSWNGIGIEGVSPRTGLPQVDVMAPGTTQVVQIQTDPFVAPEDQFSGRPLERKSRLHFRVAGAAWVRDGEEDPVRGAEAGPLPWFTGTS
ncbi:Uncharacterised protein (plasmid) [Tsukamurella tyrosinosolvens]|uniref:Uncharacterized protein n=1 Tax=Tsukamurella tyrosinosolvens TaxID=57704 RepID=A0A1H4UKV7_TSUTY|nr:hypothetical protein [Tsukamurella tyrosinosolvens]KXO99047.1 hypothetical protein AXK58_24135 [Tsukamurella tyrosinosolvens]SEC69008.1 hypothetical protein SAMN04489793_2929 [Tsukamurella tyrosinosolvens]VEH94281.1 Uncharacterised protein [Tsukamurella tyrosinosolvens]